MTNNYFEPVLPDIKQWPIVGLNNQRSEFLEEVIDTSVSHVIKASHGEWREEIARTLFSEQTRMHSNHWSFDPSDEKKYWNDVKEYLLKSSVMDENGSSTESDKKILAEIIRRYTNEIAGKFNIPTYLFAKKAFPFFFSRLMNAPLAIDKNIVLSNEKIHLNGNLEDVRALAKENTLVIVPTHFSNLDSVIVGWAIQALGLPALLYGAGFNLFGIRLFSYFMNRLGAYKVDRRKKSLSYLEALKNYSMLAIHKGCHSLFFPGGARSHSGSIEKKLKLGLLGTAMEAQFLNFKKQEHPKKIIIVPVVINYHFVMEAPFLIDQYLKDTGKEHYLIDETDRFSTSYEIIRVLLKFLTASTDFTVTFGRCMDVFGNPVDKNARSLDHAGREIDIKKYFVSKGELKSDKQRNAEYIKILGDEILRSFHSENTVYSSHLVAYAAFELIRKDFVRLDIYGLLRLPEEDRVILYKTFSLTIQKLITQLWKLVAAKKIRLAPNFGEEPNAPNFNVDELITHGLKNVGVYHANKVLKKNKRGNVITEDMKLLYYYHNRLEGYGLEV